MYKFYVALGFIVLAGCGSDDEIAKAQISGVWYDNSPIPINEDLNLESTATFTLGLLQVDSVSIDYYWVIDSDNDFTVYRSDIEQIANQPDRLRDCVTLYAIGTLEAGEEPNTYNVLSTKALGSQIVYDEVQDLLNTKSAPLEVDAPEGTSLADGVLNIVLEYTFERSDLTEDELPICSS